VPLAPSPSTDVHVSAWGEIYVSDAMRRAKCIASMPRHPDRKLGQHGRVMVVRLAARDLDLRGRPRVVVDRTLNRVQVFDREAGT